MRGATGLEHMTFRKRSRRAVKDNIGKLDRQTIRSSSFHFLLESCRSRHSMVDIGTGHITHTRLTGWLDDGEIDVR